MIGIINVQMAVLLVISVAAATTTQRTRFILQGSRLLNTDSSSPSHLDNPDSCNTNVDIKYLVHVMRFWSNIHQTCLN